MNRSKHNPELEAKLSKLAPLERKRVEHVGRQLAKASLKNMLDQTSALHRKQRMKSSGAKPRESGVKPHE